MFQGRRYPHSHTRGQAKAIARHVFDLGFSRLYITLLCICSLRNICMQLSWQNLPCVDVSVPTLHSQSRYLLKVLFKPDDAWNPQKMLCIADVVDLWFSRNRYWVYSFMAIPISIILYIREKGGAGGAVILSLFPISPSLHLRPATTLCHSPNNHLQRSTPLAQPFSQTGVWVVIKLKLIHT